MEKGLLVSLEGQDASGKSEILKLLLRELDNRKVPVVVVSEFSSNVLGNFIKKILGENKFFRLNTCGPSALTETMYVISDLYSQDELEIGPALKEGKVIIKERHIDSIFACQIPKIIDDYPGSNPEYLFKWLEQSLKKLRRPNLTFFLDVKKEILKNRIVGRGEEVSAVDLRVFQKRQNIYNKLALKNRGRWLNIKNNGRPMESVKEISDIIIDKFKLFKGQI
ncbi:deoxynucleoside kinase [Patescibacteria group bacterium]|nr:deoxynucleoside kinase [Patescibacteria group bacterium]